MPTFIDVSAVYLGSTSVNELRQGDTLVWPVWHPTDLGAALYAWWDAADLTTITDAGGGAVSQWRDKSPNARHLIQSTASSRPITGTRTLNGRNTLAFDPTGGLIPNLAIAGQTINQPFTWACVAVWDNADTLSRNMVTGGSVFLRTASGQWNISAGLSLNGGTDDAIPHTFVATFNNTSSSIRKDGVVVGAGGASTLGLANVPLVVSRGTNTTCWDGQIAEVIIATGVLSPANLDGIEKYLRTKWAT